MSSWPGHTTPGRGAVIFLLKAACSHEAIHPFKPNRPSLLQSPLDCASERNGHGLAVKKATTDRLEGIDALGRPAPNGEKKTGGLGGGIVIGTVRSGFQVLLPRHLHNAVRASLVRNNAAAVRHEGLQDPPSS